MNHWFSHVPETSALEALNVVCEGKVVTPEPSLPTVVVSVLGTLKCHISDTMPPASAHSVTGVRSL